MRILFVCGSLEPGRDGVGDYTRCLAGELIRQGHSAFLVSLFDRNVNAITRDAQHLNDIALPALRIPESVSNAIRFSQLTRFIHESEPDWLSLQFVPFSFDNRGLPFGFAGRLRDTGRGIPWHVMFHELWVGMEEGASKKLILWGWLQRKIIGSLLTTLKPSLIHTHAGLYVEHLRKLGSSPKQLPLFSSIPVVSRVTNEVPLATKSLVAFGSMHPGAPMDAFLEEICLCRKDAGVNIKLTFVGVGGGEVERWIEACRVWNVTAECLGELSTGEISQVLSKADYGLSTTPALMAEKSSAIAAMMAHGLPIICLRQFTARGFENDFVPPNISVYKKGSLSSFLREPPATTNTGDGLAAVASTFVKDLTEEHQLT